MITASPCQQFSFKQIHTFCLNQIAFSKKCYLSRYFIETPILPFCPSCLRPSPRFRQTSCSASKASGARCQWPTSQEPVLVDSQWCLRTPGRELRVNVIRHELGVCCRRRSYRQGKDREKGVQAERGNSSTSGDLCPENACFGRTNYTAERNTFQHDMWSSRPWRSYILRKLWRNSRVLSEAYKLYYGAGSIEAKASLCDYW